MKYSRLSSFLQYGVSLLFFVLLGVSTGLAFPPYNLPYTIFISIAVLIYLIDTLKFNYSKFLAGYIFCLGAGSIYISHWLSFYLQLQLGIGWFFSHFLTSLVFVYASVYSGIMLWFYFKIQTKWRFFNLVLLFPSLWTIVELVRSTFFPDTWYDLGYSQVNTIWLKGFFPLLGSYGVSWIIVAISGYIVYFIKSPFCKKIFLSIGFLFFIFFGLWLNSVHYTKKTAPNITLALVQPNVPSSWFHQRSSNDIENIILRLVQQDKATKSKNKVDILVLPETVFGMPVEYLPNGYLTKLAKASGENSALLLGSPVNNTNSIVLFNKNKLKTVYTKQHLVPWGEDDPTRGTILAPLVKIISGRNRFLLAGSSNQDPVKIKERMFAFNICYENGLGGLVAKSSRNANIMLNLSDLSWFGNTEMKDVELQFSVVRALENQRYFVQDGNTGITAVIMPDGVVQKQLPAYTNGMLTAEVVGYTGQTPYQRYTDWPIWLITLMISGVALLLRHGKFRNERPGS